MKAEKIWPAVHHERQALMHHLAYLSIEQWSTQSLCEGWTVHDVVAHLVDDARTTKVGFLVGLARAPFNFDRANQQGVERERRGSPGETLAAFRDAAGRTTSAPAPLASRLVEIIVHGEDIRRPLGINHRYPADAIIEAMRYQLATSQSMGGSKERANGLCLVTTDADFAFGEGPVVRGSAIDLLLTLTGRHQGQVELIGSGVKALQKP